MGKKKDSAFARVLQIGSPDGPLFSGKLCNKLLQPSFADLDDLELISTNRRTHGVAGLSPGPFSQGGRLWKEKPGSSRGWSWKECNSRTQNCLALCLSL